MNWKYASFFPLVVSSILFRSTVTMKLYVDHPCWTPAVDNENTTQSQCNEFLFGKFVVNRSAFLLITMNSRLQLGNLQAVLQKFLRRGFDFWNRSFCCRSLSSERWMVLAIPSSLDCTKCRYFTSIVISGYTFLCGCTAPFIRMKSRRLVIEHEAKKESRHNNKLLGISFAANQLF